MLKLIFKAIPSLWRWRHPPFVMMDNPPSIQSFLPLSIVKTSVSCQHVEIRWRSNVPADRYLVQRLPDANHNYSHWATLADGHVLEVVDRQIGFDQEYTYRVQAVNGVWHSVSGNYTVFMNSSVCLRPSTTLSSPICTTSVHAPLSYISSLDAVQICGVLVSFFIAIFVLVRLKMEHLQRAHLRYGRLLQMQQSAIEHRQTQVNRPSTVSTASSSSIISTKRSSFQVSRPLKVTLPSGASLCRSIPMESNHPPLPTTSSPSHNCDYCKKKFGLFRHRHVCDICEIITLCRKCIALTPRSVLDPHYQAVVATPSISRFWREGNICPSCLVNSKLIMTHGDLDQ